MKKIITCLLVFFSIQGMAQDKSAGTSVQEPSQARNAGTSGKVQATKPPYDINDKYMGRKDEFLNQLIVSELPADFPLYRKEWGVKEYNAVVDAYYMEHMDILKDRVKQKVQLLKDQQGK